MHERDFVVHRHSSERPWAGFRDVSAELRPRTEAPAKQFRFVEAEILATLKADDRAHQPNQLRHVAFGHGPYLDGGSRSRAGVGRLLHLMRPRKRHSSRAPY